MAYSLLVSAPLAQPRCRSLVTVSGRKDLLQILLMRPRKPATRADHQRDKPLSKCVKAASENHSNGYREFTSPYLLVSSRVILATVASKSGFDHRAPNLVSSPQVPHVNPFLSQRPRPRR